MKIATDDNDMETNTFMVQGVSDDNSIASRTPTHRSDLQRRDDYSTLLFFFEIIITEHQIHDKRCHLFSSCCAGLHSCFIIIGVFTVQNVI